MDKELLVYYLKKAGLSIQDIAKRLGLNDKTFYNKLNGRSEFKASEIRIIADRCMLSSKEIISIFFADYVE